MGGSTGRLLQERVECVLKKVKFGTGGRDQWQREFRPND